MAELTKEEALLLGVTGKLRARSLKRGGYGVSFRERGAQCMMGLFRPSAAAARDACFIGLSHGAREQPREGDGGGER